MSVDSLKALDTFVEARLDKLGEEIDRRFEAAVRKQLDAWAQRWPRHRFEAFQGHGMLSFSVEPRIGGQSRIDRIPEWLHRGAIAELEQEADAFVTASCELEWRLSNGDFAPISSTGG